jgi:hypothetical protein
MIMVKSGTVLFNTAATAESLVIGHDSCQAEDAKQEPEGNQGERPDFANSDLDPKEGRAPGQAQKDKCGPVF